MKSLLSRKESDRRASKAAKTTTTATTTAAATITKTHICAIDFGTAFTRSAHATSQVSVGDGRKEVSQAQIGDHWPGPGNVNVNIASVLRYDGQHEAVWGPTVDGPEGDQLMFLKLCEQPQCPDSPDLHIYLTFRSLLDEPGPENPEVIDEMAKMYGGRYSVDRPEAPLDFLRAVMKHLLHLFKAGTPSLNANEQIIFLLTVPRGWSEGAKHSLLRCASQALPAGSQHSVKIVYDAEAALGVFSDRVTHMTLVPITDPAADSPPPAPLAEGEVVVIYDVGLFTTIKWDFKDQPTTEYTVPRAPSSPQTSALAPPHLTIPCGVLDDPTEGIRDETLTLHRKDVLSIFNPILNACDNHIQTELAAMKKLPDVSQPPPRIATFVLVGGLSNSPVLQKKIAAMPELRDVRLVCPQGCSSITVIGAIEAHCHGGFLAKTESKFTLAIAFWTPWHDGHPIEKRMWERYELKYYARDCMRWFLKRVSIHATHLPPASPAHRPRQGQEYSRTTPTRLDFYKNVAVSEPLVFEDTLWITDRDDPLPAFKDKDCRPFATLTTVLPDALKARLKRLPRSMDYGGDYVAVPYSIELRIGVAFSAKVLFQGR
ncbi:hypothetical protein GP486_005780 [Trichoglossum hirsutum]|uniref:Actin-like ATPase domain-containing protein n=1 Tax=Trichoglossum hirsutum TaxID=265104 RepID=A0A9P8L8K5_9PEZI|nr:hypothetical protein GP486_005780 [Trichoglossum hirsutum]